ncbi:MAG TPA: 2-oxo acid dehydrogenase subunit E2, partial [Nakamurella sp.]|nr:2-oxo acid dehydrogenase subunit E2 [Nakamurella sp.]
MSSATVPEFGPNDWFVEEKYQQFLADPESVDPIWRDFFSDTGSGIRGPETLAGHGESAADPAGENPPSAGAAGSAGAGTTTAGTTAASSPAPPAPGSRPVPPPPPPPNRPPAKANPTPPAAATAPLPAANGAAENAAAEQAPAQPTSGMTNSPPPPPARAGGKEAVDLPQATSRPTRPTTTATPDDMVAAKAAKAARATQDAEGSGETATPIRGAAATVVKNMTSSLEVPTATSVRAVPAKLMADNRIVINNFLKRNRGGKISFTHLIGYAIVRAIADFPSMNRHFAVADGKPTI